MLYCTINESKRKYIYSREPGLVVKSQSIISSPSFLDVFFALNPIDRPALLIDLSPRTRIHIAAPARTAEETPGTIPGLYLVTRPTKAEETGNALPNGEMVRRVVVTAAMMATVMTMPMATA